MKNIDTDTIQSFVNGLPHQVKGRPGTLFVNPNAFYILGRSAGTSALGLSFLKYALINKNFRSKKKRRTTVIRLK